MKLKKILRVILICFLILLALCGIPVAPPHKFEADKYDETKTELVEGREEKD